MVNATLLLLAGPAVRLTALWYLLVSRYFPQVLMVAAIGQRGEAQKQSFMREGSRSK